MKRKLLTLLSIAILTVFLLPYASPETNTVEAQRGIDCSKIPTSVGRVPLRLAEACGGSGQVAPEGGEFPTDFAYGPNNTASDWVNVQLNNPGVFNPFGVAPPVSFINSCDFDNSGTFTNLVCVGIFGEFFSVDTGTGVSTPVGTLTPFGGEFFTDISTDPTTGYLYAISTDVTASSLYRIDNANTAARIGAIPGMPGAIGIGFDPSGQLFGYDIVTDAFYSINKASGVDTLIGPLGFDANFGQGMDFDETDGTCYMFAFNNATFQPELRTCNGLPTTFLGVLGNIVPGGLNQMGDAGIAAGGGGPNPYALVLEDDNNGNCLLISPLTGQYWFRAPGGPYTGPGVLVPSGNVLNIASGPGDLNTLQGGISLTRDIGNARIMVPGGAVYTIYDRVVSNSSCP